MHGIPFLEEVLCHLVMVLPTNGNLDLPSKSTEVAAASEMCRILAFLVSNIIEFSNPKSCKVFVARHIALPLALYNRLHHPLEGQGTPRLIASPIQSSLFILPFCDERHEDL
jgi:hypothetical protein